MFLGFFLKVNVQRDLLLSVLSKIHGVVSTKAIVPVISNISLEAKDNSIILTATDLTVTMAITIPANVKKNGSAILPARCFYQLIKELQSVTVDIECSEKGVSLVTTHSSHFSLCTLGSAEETFPQCPKIQEGKSFSINVLLLKEMLINTSFASARDDSRQVLKSLLFDIHDDLFTVVGTDGKRLAMAQKTIESNNISSNQSIVPLKAVEEMMKLLDGDGHCVITILDKMLFLEYCNVMFVSKLLLGKYPDYNRVIPKSKGMNYIKLHKEEITSLLKQVSLFVSESNKSVKFLFDKGEVVLQVQNSTLGKGSVKMPVNYFQKLLEIAFNPYYFLDILKHCKEDIVSLGISDSYNPGLICDSRGYQFVLMPMRLNV